MPVKVRSRAMPDREIILELVSIYLVKISSQIRRGFSSDSDLNGSSQCIQTSLNDEYVPLELTSLVEGMNSRYTLY